VPAVPEVTSGPALATATRRAPTVGGRRIRRVLAWAVTFHAVCLGWVFFRATSFANAGQVLGRLFASGRHVHLDVMVVTVVACSLAVQWFPARWSARMQRVFVRWSIPAQALALAGVLVVIDAFGPAGVAPFIYFRF
jgi:hypothetical protein